MFIPKSLATGDNYTRAVICPEKIEITVEQAIPKVYQYAQKNRMTTLVLYYENAKSQKALFAAPDNVYIQNENNYVKKTLLINGINLNKNDPQQVIIEVSLNNETFNVDGMLLENLLKKGEEHLYVNDLIGNIKGVDFKIPGIASSKAYEIICESLFIAPTTGDITDRNLASIKGNALLEIDWLKLGFKPSQWIIKNFFLENFSDSSLRLISEEEIADKLQEIRAQFPGQVASIHKELNAYLQIVKKYSDQIKNIISTKIDKSTQLTNRYNISAGLFAFLKDYDFIFTPNLGRGNHSVFFNYYAGKKFGMLTPLSFIDIIKTKNASAEQLSKDIYNYFLAQKVINKKGFIQKELGYSLLPIKYQKYVSENDFNQYFKNTSPYYTVLAKYILNNLNDPRIKELLKALRLSTKINHLKLKDLSTIIKKLFSQIKDIEDLENYIEALIAEMVSKYVVYNRGIVQKDSRGNILLLFSDNVEKTAEYYSTVINQIKSRLKLDPKTNIKIAYAYKNPSPRTKSTQNNAMDKLIAYLLNILPH